MKRKSIKEKKIKEKKIKDKPNIKTEKFISIQTLLEIYR